MTPEQIALVKRTWHSAAGQSLLLADLFYQKLFALDPALRPLFLNDICAQRKKFHDTFTLLVEHLGADPAALASTVHRLGVQHAGYGVKDEHYATAERALLWALKESLGDAFGEPAEQAWRQAYRALAQGMIGADLDQHQHPR